MVPLVCPPLAGYYPAGAPPKSNSQAQIDMIDETLKWAGVETVKSVSVALRNTSAGQGGILQEHATHFVAHGNSNSAPADVKRAWGSLSA